METIQCLDRDAWLKERRNGIGGSDAPAIMGLSPWSNPVELFQDKLGLAEPKDETSAMKWGNRLEPVIRAAFEEESGIPVSYLGPHVIGVRDGIPWQRVSLDGMAEHPDVGRCIVQIKTAHAASKDKWALGVPDVYRAQVQHEMLVAGTTHALVVVLFGGNDLQWFLVPADPAFQDLMTVKEERFWQHVIAKEPPAAHTDDEAASLAKQLLTVTKGKRIELPAAWLHRHNEQKEIQAQLRELNERAKKFRNDIIIEAGDAEVLAFGDVEYGVKLVEKKPYTVKAQRYRVVNQLGSKKGDDE